MNDCHFELTKLFIWLKTCETINVLQLMRDSNRIILLRKITIHVHFETNTSVLLEDLGTILQEQCSPYTLIFLTDDDFDKCHHYNNSWSHTLQIQVEAEKHVLCRHGKIHR